MTFLRILFAGSCSFWLALAAPRAQAQDSSLTKESRGGHGAVPLALATLVADPSLAEGQVLRVRSGPRRITGRLREVRGDTLRLQVTPFASLVQGVPITATTRLEVRAGRVSRARGAALGAAAGAVAGVLLGVSIVEAFHGSSDDIGTVSVVLLPYSIPTGAITGALLPGHRWRVVRLAPR